MTICWCTIFVNDMDASIAFYQDFVGLPLQTRYIAGNGNETAFLGDPEKGAQVELIYTGRGTSHADDAASLAFETDSLDRMLALLHDRGLPVVNGPVRTNPHIHYLVTRDPNGFSVAFIERHP